MPALLVVAELTLVRDDRRWPARLAALVRPAVVLGLVGCTYLLVRETILGSWAGDYPTWTFAHATMATRGWTMLGATPQWVRLMIWPARLAVEYGPQEIPLRTHADIALIAPAAIVIGAMAVAVLARRRAPAVTFGLSWFAVALFPTSNLLFATGVVVAERTLFLPSVGAMMVVGAVAGRVMAALAGERALWRRMELAAIGLLLAAGLARTALRERDGQSDATLAWRKVQDEPLDYLGHYTYGHLLIANGYVADGEGEMRRALALFSGDPEPYAELGDVYATAHRCDDAVPLFRRALALLPKHPVARLGLAKCLLERGDYVGARSQARIGLSYPYDRDAFRMVEDAGDRGAAAAAIAAAESRRAESRK